jgi:hypothetical protein
MVLSKIGLGLVEGHLLAKLWDSLHFFLGIGPIGGKGVV